MPIDDRDKRIRLDENNNEYLTDKDGNPLKDERGNNITPSKTSKKTDDGAYDMSKGHCGLCGKLSCNGNCFK